MITLEADLHEVINLDAYPLHQPEGAAMQGIVARTHEELAQRGCSVLEGFIRTDVLQQLEEQGKQVAGQAYYSVETVNAYNIELDRELDPEHPASITFERGNAFVARDQIPIDFMIQRLYSADLFKQFVARCFQMPVIHELADPLAGLCVNVLQQGKEHPWHYDTNDFTVSLLTKPASAGGKFEYCPNIRSPENENFAKVRQVIEGNPDNVVVRELDLQCGDLQLFRGRHALHRVTAVQSEAERHTAIFAYTQEAGVIGKVERTRQLFGRVLPEHYAAEKQSVRSDALMD